MTDWYARPVLFVKSVERTLDFYTRKLGFIEINRYEEDGVALVGQISRDGCAILVSCQSPERNGTARIFIELDQEALNAARNDFIARGASLEQGWWGYNLMIVRDPDGNELFFPYPSPRGDTVAPVMS